MTGGAGDFQRPRTATAPADRGINAACPFETECQITSFRSGDHIATAGFNRTPRGFFVTGEHHDHARVFERAEVSQRLQRIKQDHVTAFHIRAAVAVGLVAFPAEALTLKDRVDVSKQENSFAPPASSTGLSNEMSGAIHLGRHVYPPGG